MRLILCATLLFLLYCSTSAQETVTVEASGVGVVFNGDTVTAYEAAVIDAKRNAIEKALGVYVESETVVRNYLLITDKILSHAEGYIIDWKELSQKTADSMLEVTISATVRSGLVVKDYDAVKALLKAKNPYVLVIIREKFGKNKYTGKWENNTLSQAETTVRELLLEKQVIVKDPMSAAGMNAAMKKLYAGDYADIIAIAKKIGANLIIFGDAVAENAGKVPIEGTDMNSYQCDITLRAVEVDTGTIIATASEHFAKPHVSDTAGMKVVTATASKKAGEKIITDCVNWWKDALSGQGYRIEMTITAVSYTQAQTFIDMLKIMVRGIQSAELRSFGNGTAFAEIRYMGPGPMFVSEIQAKKVPQKIEVLSVSETALSVKLK